VRCGMSLLLFVPREFSWPAIHGGSLWLSETQETCRWPQQAWMSALRNQKDGSVKGAVSTLYSLSRSSVRHPSVCSEARIASRLCNHHRPHGLPPRTTAALALWRIFTKPQRSNNIGSFRPNVGSYPRDTHHSPFFQARW
jgi:hypothetical protein